DVVLGKLDFTQNSFGKTTATDLEIGGGILVDTTTTPNRVYVVDTNHSRILGFADTNIYLGRVPDVLIGQPSFDRGAANLDGTAQRYPELIAPTSATLALMNPIQISTEETVVMVQLAVDEDHALYVCDVFNDRVLKYEDPFATDSVADEVWGQPDFNSREANNGGRSASSLDFRYAPVCAGATIGPDGSLWVADSMNDRVLRFLKDPGSGVIAKTADLVLGQSDFTSGAPGSGMDELTNPAGLAVSSAGTVYVTDMHFGVST
ncbi:unnamed protein product, partial [marine sediment metagenome]